jgi:membrane protein implicated in regulation of membrane protease activity
MEGGMELTNSIYWLLVLGILILVEIIALNLTTIWFAAGALLAFVVSLFYDNLFLELILFLITSLALLYFIRPWILRYFNPKKATESYEGVIGKNGLVNTKIDNSNKTGKVTVDGQEWSARSLEGSIIEEGSKVRIQAITGAKLVVSKLREER